MHSSVLLFIAMTLITMTIPVKLQELQFRHMRPNPSKCDTSGRCPFRGGYIEEADHESSKNDNQKERPAVLTRDDYPTSVGGGRPGIGSDYKPVRGDYDQPKKLQEDDHIPKPVQVSGGYDLKPVSGDDSKELVEDHKPKPPSGGSFHEDSERGQTYDVKPPPPVVDSVYLPRPVGDKDDYNPKPVRGGGGYLPRPVADKDDYSSRPGEGGYQNKPIADEDYNVRPGNGGYHPRPVVDKDVSNPRPGGGGGYHPRPVVDKDEYDPRPANDKDDYLPRPVSSKDDYNPRPDGGGYHLKPVDKEVYPPRPIRNKDDFPTRPIRDKDDYLPRPIRDKDDYPPRPIDDKDDYNPRPGGGGYYPKPPADKDDYNPRPISDKDHYNPRPGGEDFKPYDDYTPRPGGGRYQRPAGSRDHYRHVITGEGGGDRYNRRPGNHDRKDLGGYDKMKDYDHHDDYDTGGGFMDDDIGRPAKEGQCICVPYYQCKEGHIVTDGSGIIDARKRPEPDRPSSSSCGPLHTCCNSPETSTVTPYEHMCGVRNPYGINSRILAPSNKGEADFGEYPWQAAVLKVEGDVNHFLCGGVLIDRSHVLTVAHCVFHLHKYGDHPLKVRLGEWDTQMTTEFLKHEDYRVSKVTVHPDFRNTSLWNDLAVLRLEEPVDYAPHIDTVCLPRGVEAFAGMNCVVTGWGKDIYRGGSFSNIMKEVVLQVIDGHQCEEMLRKTRLGRFFQLHEGFLCAGGEYGLDSCKGDGGGPLVCRRKDNSHALVGLVSWGIDCGQPAVPGVYVKVQNYLDWISKTTGVGLQDYWPKQ